MRRLAPLALVACGAPVYLPKEPPQRVGVHDTGPETPDDTGPTLPGTPELPCSGGGSTPLTFTVDNRLPAAVDVLWLDFGCAEVPYTSVGPGETWDIASYDTHVWIGRDLASHAYVGSIVLDATPAQTLVFE